MTKIGPIFIGLVSLFIVSQNSFAEVNVFENIDMATITVNGEEVTFPVGDLDRKSDIYFLKKALLGDVEALEVFLGGKEEKWFFIGIETSRWLYVNKNGFKVVNPQ